MADVQTTSLYEQDFYLWALDQARAVRELRDAASGQGDLEATLHSVDWDNVIEELDGLATGVRSELQSRLATILEHLVKSQLSSAIDPRRGWEETVQRSRREIEIRLNQSPSLRREVPAMMASHIMLKAVTATVETLVRYGEAPLGTPAPNYTARQLLEDCWPDQRVSPP